MPGPADELVGRDEDRVLVGERVGLPAGRVGERTHLDRDVRRRGGEVPERQRAVAVEQDRDRPDVADDPGHVRGRRERADLQRPVGVGDELGLEPLEVDPPVVVLGDDDDVGQRLAPRQLVAVVLVRSDEHDRPLARRDQPGQVVAIVEVGRQADLEAVDELVDRPGRARAGEQDDVVVLGPADRLADDPPGVLAEAGRLEPGPRRFGVGVAVERQDRVADEVLDERERATRRGVVGVRHPAQPERPDDRLVVADDVGPDRLDEGRGLVHAGLS